MQTVRVAWLAQKFIADRLLWAAMNDVLDLDMVHAVIRDNLINRDGS